MGEKSFWNYVRKVYRKAMLMHSNESFSITEVCETKTEPLFRDILTAIIHMHPGEYLFSDDYKEFKKTDTDQLEQARAIRAKIYRTKNNTGDSPAPAGDGIRSQAIHTPGKDFPNKKPVSQSGIRSSKTKVCAS